MTATEKQPLWGLKYPGGLQDEAESNIEVLESRRPTSGVGRTFMNLLKSYMGSGMLGLPWAFSQAGLPASIVIMVLCAILSTHTMVLLVQAKRRIERKDCVTFSDVAFHTYGNWARITVDGLLCFMQFGFCVIYLVYVGNQVATFFPDMSPTLCRIYVMLAAFPFFGFFVLLRQLKYVAPISALSELLILFGLAIVLAGSAIQLSDKVLPSQWMSVGYEVPWGTLPIMASTAVYAFEGVGLVLPCETAMQDRFKFNPVLLSVMAIASVNYIGFGLVCYLAFGNSVGQEVTANISQLAQAMGGSSGQHWDALQVIVRISLIGAIACSFPNQMFPVIDIIEGEMYKPERCSRDRMAVTRTVMRLMLVVVGMVLALVVPHFGLLIGLIGAIGSASLQLIFPPLFWLKVFPEQPALLRGVVGSYVVVGVAVLVFGTYSSVAALVSAFQG